MNRNKVSSIQHFFILRISNAGEAGRRERVGKRTRGRVGKRERGRVGKRGARGSAGWQAKIQNSACHPATSYLSPITHHPLPITHLQDHELLRKRRL
jgi:hypothetical protein